MLYVMIMPEPATSACGQQGTYVEPLTAACGRERVNISSTISFILEKGFRKQFVLDKEGFSML